MSNMSKKTIQINPEYFTLNNKTKNKKNKTQKIKPKDLSKFVKPSKAKIQLLQMIKEHKKKHQNNNKQNNNNEHNNNEQNNDIESSLTYLEQVVKKNKLKKKQKKQKTTLINNKEEIKQETKQETKPIINFNKEEIKQETKPSIHFNKEENKIYTSKNLTNHTTIKKEPPYGCLKGGNKPTLSQYKKTLKQPQHILIDINKTNMKKENTQLNLPKKNKKIRKIRYKKTFKVGKQKNKSKISVLIKNRKTQKKIQQETNSLQRKPINEIKKYLREKNLIKIGSNAPENVVREIYKNAILSGDILNKSKDVLIHNYLKDENKN